VLETLVGDEHTVRSALAQLDRQLEKLCRIDPELTETQALLDSAGIRIDEAVQNLRRYMEHIALDPARLAALDQLIGQLHDCARKHRTAIDELPALAERLQQELDTLDQSEQQLDALADTVATQQAAFLQQAQQLGKSRRAAATALGETVTESMQELGMKGGLFQVLCSTDDTQATRHGINRIQFAVAANPGQTPAALSAVASGGELSRISLALRTATANCGRIPTLIFDEVDAGIGGATAEIVGQLLRKLGAHRQVICVTHLPQVAAQAHRHFKVQKSSDGKSTEARISALNESARSEEIARMLGGVNITEQTRRHADEMIARARGG